MFEQKDDGQMAEATLTVVICDVLRLRFAHYLWKLTLHIGISAHSPLPYVPEKRGSRYQNYGGNDSAFDAYRAARQPM